ncbi:hypothetical protein TRAPUB_2354 [Trametes pubescens]|uniref:Uncharacterized protein n=1 Tax=Trametes pubescens TaxID=154538 RepID=A0A1M2VGT6_TRAPU|nr:hypothetical protein TRAPUB_2354 [Trametes pubescens]
MVDMWDDSLPRETPTWGHLLGYVMRRLGPGLGPTPPAPRSAREGAALNLWDALDMDPHKVLGLNKKS